MIGVVLYLLLRPTFGPENNPWFNHTRGRGDYYQEKSLKRALEMLKQNNNHNQKDKPNDSVEPDIDDVTKK